MSWLVKDVQAPSQLAKQNSRSKSQTCLDGTSFSMCWLAEIMQHEYPNQLGRSAEPTTGQCHDHQWTSRGWGAKVLNRTSTVGRGTDELAGSAAGWSATYRGSRGGTGSCRLLLLQCA